MTDTESRPLEPWELTAEHQLRDMAWCLNIRLMRMVHDEFTDFVQTLPQEAGQA